MAKSIRDIKLDWNWEGDIEDLKGFNVALCHSAQTPLQSTAAFATVIDPTKRSYIFKNMICSVGLEYEGFVQAIYSDVDSAWVSTGSILTIPDDGQSTVAQKREVNDALFVAEKKNVTYSQASTPTILDDSYGDLWLKTNENNRPYRCSDMVMQAYTISFARNSWAYTSSGGPAIENAPRYEVGKFNRAIFIEEGTTNILSENQSSVESSVADFASSQCQIGQWPYAGFGGGACLRAYTSISGSAGVWTSTSAGSISAGELISASAYMYTSSPTGYNFRLSIEWKNSSNQIISTSTGEYVSANHYMSRLAVSGTAPAGTNYVTVTLYSENTPQYFEFYTDGWQVEKKLNPTRWQIGGTPRSNEILTIPTTNRINQTNGTIAGWFYQENLSSSGLTNYFNCTNLDCWCDATGYHAKLGTAEVNTGVTLKTGWTHIALTWTPSRLALFINGVLVGSANRDATFVTLGNTIYLGCNLNGTTGQVNGLIEDLRFYYNRTLGDSEVFMLYKYNESVSDLSYLARFNDNLDTTTLGWVLVEDLRVADIVADSKFSPVEKQMIRTEWEGIYSEKLKYVTQATAFALTGDAAYTTYISAYTALANYLNNGTTWTEGATPPSWINNTNIATSTDIVAATFRTTFKDYYDARQGLNNRLEAYAATKANWDGVSSKPSTLEAPSGTGLFLTPNAMGYYTGGSWTSYIDNTGKFRFSGNGTNFIDWGITAADTLTIRGKLTASDIQSGGTLSGQNISGGTISIGSGNSIFKADSNGIYLGNATFASAPFRVTPSGNLTATNATISGSITVTGGSIPYSYVSGYDKPTPYATSGKSLCLPIEQWILYSNTLETVSDGKVGNRVLRLGINSTYPITPNTIAIDPSKKYRVRFWARPNSTCNGYLYFCLRQFQNVEGTIEGPYNGGRGPYKPSGVTRAVHNGIFGVDAWGEYSYNWDANDWQAGCKWVRPEFLDNYAGTTGYWEVQDLVFEEYTDTIRVGTYIDDSGIYTGTLTANQIRTGTLAASQSISVGSMVLGTSTGTYGYLRCGKDSADDPALGFWLGYDGSLPKFHIGNSTNSLNWNGSSLTITGAINATSGTFSGNITSSATITGGILQTSPAGNDRVVIDDTNDRVMYKLANDTEIGSLGLNEGVVGTYSLKRFLQFAEPSGGLSTDIGYLPVSINTRRGVGIDIFHYGWISNLTHSGPTTASYCPPVIMQMQTNLSGSYYHQDGNTPFYPDVMGISFSSGTGSQYHGGGIGYYAQFAPPSDDGSLFKGLIYGAKINAGHSAPAFPAVQGTWTGVAAAGLHYGMYAQGGRAPICLVAASGAGNPTSNAAHKGSLWVDSNGILYIKTTADGVGTSPGYGWVKVGTQT